MSKQIGTLLVSGDIGNIGFFQRKGKAYARKRTTIDAKRFATDPAFERTRENSEEFKTSAKAGKLLRENIRPLLTVIRDSSNSTRLHRLMAQVKNHDAASARGARNVATGLSTVQGKEILKGFNFNEGAILNRVVYKQYEVDTTTGVITIEDLLPMEDVVFPPGATHMSLKGCWARVNFTTGEAESAFSNIVNLAKLGTPASDAILTPTGVPTITGVDFFLLLVCFYQEINGVQYALKNGAFNALSIVEVA
jgi:hypothetical protein